MQIKSNFKIKKNRSMKITQRIIWSPLKQFLLVQKDTFHNYCTFINTNINTKIILILIKYTFIYLQSI